jgi:XapX domain-containing protein
MKLFLGFLLAFAIGVGCRLARIPSPAPNAIIGGLLVVSMSTGYVLTDKWLDRRRTIANVFVMTGAQPNSEWLRGCVDMDARGLIQTGAEIAGSKPGSPYSTALAGVFAVGDVRSGSVKRITSAVGEGSVVVAAIHEYLASYDVPAYSHASVSKS